MSDNYTKRINGTLISRPYLGLRWIHFTTPENGSLPPYPCCYCIYVGGALAYIGQTNNLRERILYHRAKRKFPTGFTLKARFGERCGDWAMRELRLIRRLRPKMNALVL